MIFSKAFDRRNKRVRGLWNDEFLCELGNFPAGTHDDEVDALSGAYEQIGGRGAPFEAESVSLPRRTRQFGDLGCLCGFRDRWAPRQGLWY